MGTQLGRLNEELEKLKSMLLEMSALVESAVLRSITAVVQQDRKLAEEVLRTEHRVNQMEIEIDNHAIGLLALQQTVASDLRLITSAIKINTQLERMGDLGATIARQAKDLTNEPMVEPVIDIPRIGGLVQSMVRGALDAFVANSAEQAAKVLASDHAVDELRTAFLRRTYQLHAARAGQDSAGFTPPDRGPKPGAHCGSLHQHRRKCFVLREGNRGATPRRGEYRGRA